MWGVMGGLGEGGLLSTKVKPLVSLQTSPHHVVHMSSELVRCFTQELLGSYSVVTSSMAVSVGVCSGHDWWPSTSETSEK